VLRLSGSNVALELNVVGYQFSDCALDGWDSEWLVVQGKVTIERGSWKFLDPCLTTFELAALADWMRSSPSPGREIGFVEPNLHFECRAASECNTLVVSLSQEAAPPWSTDQQRYGSGVSIEFRPTSDDYMNYANTLYSMLRVFPSRVQCGASG
jgi:hypothetical protein